MCQFRFTLVFYWVSALFLFVFTLFPPQVFKGSFELGVTKHFYMPFNK